MIVKYCNNCPGRPYTEDLNALACPVCGAALQVESVEKGDLFGRCMLPGEKNDFAFGDFPTGAGSSGFDKSNQTDMQPKFDPWGSPSDESGNNSNLKPSFPDTVSPQLLTTKSTSTQSTVNNGIFLNQRTIRGKVSQYTSSGKEDGEYRRFLPQKIYDAIVYRQRLEDVLHRFVVRVEHDEDELGYQQYNDIPVNIHGTISGGLQLVDNAEVEVHGKYRKNGVLMADEIHVISNGYESKVGFQRSVKAIVYGILSALMFFFVCFVAATSDGNFFASIKEFCTVWLITAAVLSVLYLLTQLTTIGILSRMFSKKKRSFPIFGILLVSLALAFLFVSAFGSFAGFGSYLSGWIYSIVPIVIIIVAIFFMIKSLF
ncbi:MAG: hypothetical protein IIW48_01455 [Clostridia bacterium]|nr:hypothetical protein [Clostridia bacterium]